MIASLNVLLSKHGLQQGLWFQRIIANGKRCLVRRKAGLIIAEDDHIQNRQDPIRRVTRHHTDLTLFERLVA